tara:strand:- start:70 stop:297 length:228 start_codon:yes stop_codon:yes gene_type:complete
MNLQYSGALDAMIGDAKSYSINFPQEVIDNIGSYLGTETADQILNKCLEEDLNSKRLQEKKEISYNKIGSAKKLF